MALVAVFIMLTSCSDSAEPPREFIEPVPFDPATDLPVTPTSAEVSGDTTTTPPPTFDTDAAAERAMALFDVIVEGNSLGDVPEGAWADFAHAGCEEGIWDRGVNFAFVEDFATLPFDAVESTDEMLLAELLWLRAVGLCGEDFPEGAIELGPPPSYEFPKCRQRFELWVLPWSDEVGEPVVEHRSDIGLTEWVWLDDTVTSWLTITQGDDDTFVDQYAAGSPIGEINGSPATAIEGTGAVVVTWREGDGHCDAFRMLLRPKPDTDDLAAFAQSLLQPPPGFFANAAELRMDAAIAHVEGYTSAGGEPSHGGEDATLIFERGMTWFHVHAIPADVTNPTPPDIIEAIEVDGTTYSLFESGPMDDAVNAVEFEADGYRITVLTGESVGPLVAFALEFHRAWLAVESS